MPQNPTLFFDRVRANLFQGVLTQGQVDGLNVLLQYQEEHYPVLQIEQHAYILATTYHETAFSMQPIDERGKGRGLPYGVPDAVTGKVYYGRGYVQLTWKANYQQQSRKLGLDLVTRPERALEPAIAAAILFGGMCDGDFTGKKLGAYITPAQVDYVQARRVVNGLDRATAIAGYAKVFAFALTDAGQEKTTV